MESFGGASGIRDFGALKSAVAQPRATFGGKDLYPTITEKAASLCFFIVMNHAFLDGNKRVGHAAMAVFLYLNGYDIDASIDEQERIMLAVAAGGLDRHGFTDWVNQHAITLRK